MSPNRRYGSAAGATLLLASMISGMTPTAAQESQRSPAVGQSLADALRSLQAEGLGIVFTSNIVSPDLRVRTEPRAGTPKGRLDELLAPHGLEARAGPGGTIQIVRQEPRVTGPQGGQGAVTGAIEGRAVHAWTGEPLSGAVVHVDRRPGGIRTDAAGRFLIEQVESGRRTLRASMAGFTLVTSEARVTAGTTVTVTLRLVPASTHSEFVNVSGSGSYRQDQGVASETSLDRTRLAALQDGLADDPVRLVTTLPHVTAVDDFRSEFVVRGSPFRQTEIVVDGVATPWLQHAAHGRGATGSVAMLTGQVLEEATLRAGAYPRRYGDRLGPQLELTLREGSRAGFGLRGVVGGTHATVIGEGPIGRAARGSWLVAGRQSYLEWPMERTDSTRALFGFADGVAKVVYDPRPSQQVALTVLGGRSNIDADDNPHAAIGDGTNRSSLVNVAWRSSVGASRVLHQRAYVVSHLFLNKHATGRDDRGSAREIAYRADFRDSIAGGLLEAGTQIGRVTARQTPRDLAPVEGSSWARSAYAHFRWAATPALTLSPGVRTSMSTLSPKPSIARWILSEWTLGRGFTLNAAAGIAHQLPEIRHTLGNAGSSVGPERAMHLDVAIEQNVASSLGWQATVFTRREADILREPDIHPRLVHGALEAPKVGSHTNALHGRSTGIELVVDRRSDRGFAGWASYAYGRTRHTDVDRHETFWADFDQRHSVKLFGAYRFADRGSVSATYRAGTNFPIPGYLAFGDGGLEVGTRRNQVRLPAYARLDVRADRHFDRFGRRLMLFLEVLNVLNHTNIGLANGTIDGVTGKAIGFTDTLFPRRASAGVLIAF